MGSVAGSVLMKLGGSVSNDPDGVLVHSIALFVALLCICILIGHLLEENRWIDEFVIALIIGLGTGVILLLITKGESSRVMEFNKYLFFILPLTSAVTRKNVGS